MYLDLCTKAFFRIKFISYYFTAVARTLQVERVSTFKIKACSEGFEF